MILAWASPFNANIIMTAYIYIDFWYHLSEMGEIINRFSYIFNICTEEVTKRCYYCNIIKMTCTRKYIKNNKIK